MLMQKQFKNFKFLLLLICLIFYNNHTLFSQTKVKPLVFHGGYTFSSFKGQKSAAIYITIINSGEKDVKINSISTDVAKKAEIHEIISEEDIIKMKKIDNFLVKKSDTVFFQPGGTHIMVFGLEKELIDKETFKINILTNDSKTYSVDILIIDKKLR